MVESGSTLNDLSSTHLSLAREDPHGRSADILVHDGPLRQTLMAMVADTVLGEHNSPPAVSLQVLTGAVKVIADDSEVVLSAGELRGLSRHRHSVTALEDSVFILTTVTGTGEPSRR
jgi:quercetin dioxygenase-like cupin family protein